MIDQETLNKGLGLFLEAMRQYIPALMMTKYGKGWNEKYYEALAPAQQRIWDTNNRDGEKSPQLMIDFGNLANFSIKNKALLREDFGRGVNNLPAQFNQIAEARNMAAHFDEFDESKARLAFLQMEAIAGKLKMSELTEEFKTLQSGDSASKPEPAIEKPEKGFLPPWFSVVKPHMDIQMGQLDESVFAADLSEVALGTGREIYVNHSWFFEKTYFTEGLRNIGRRVIQCLNGGESGENRVITLQTGFGGGKTHTLISLYHMVKAGPALKNIDKVNDAIGIYPRSDQAKVAVFTNRTNDPVQGRTVEDVHIRTLWGELAWQIGGPTAYGIIRENDEKGVAPGGNLFKKILNEAGPVLILIDELADYCVKASAVERGQSTLSDQTISFMQDLTESVSQCDHAVMVVTLPASVTEVANSTLAQGILSSLSDRVARVGADTRPVAEDEIFEVIRHRLFERIGDVSLRKDVVSQYVGHYQNLFTDLPGYAPTSEYREMMERSYPFHPELINIFRNKWASHPNFQRTRGVLRILASIVSDLWKRRQSLTGEQAMIHSSHIELANLNTLTGEVKKLYGNGYDAVITQDISGTGSNARMIDDARPSYGNYRLTQGIATTIFLNTFGSDGVNRGIEVSHLKLQMISPHGFNHNSINGSLDEFQGRAYYLYYNTSGGAQRFWFHTKPNINILINKAQNEIETRDVEEYILDALRKATSRISRIRVVVAPESDMPEQKSPLLVIISPEIAVQDTKKLEAYCREIVTKKGNGERIYRNVFVFMSMSRDLRDNLYQSVRTLLASEKVNGEYKSQLGEDQVEDLRERISSLKKESSERLITSYANVHRYSVSGGLQSLSLMRFSRNFENQIGENLMELLKENYWLLEKVGTGVLDRSGLLPRDGEPIATSEIVEALLRFDDKPMIESPRVITDSLSHYMYEGQFAIGVWSGEEFSRMYYQETVSQFDATDEIYRLVSKTDYEKWRRQGEDQGTGVVNTENGDIQDPGSIPGGTTVPKPEQEAGPTTEEEPAIIRSIVISGTLNPKDFQDFFRAFVYPLKDNHLSMEITLRAGSTMNNPLEKDHPKIKSIREAARQLGLEMVEEE